METFNFTLVIYVHISCMLRNCTCDEGLTDKIILTWSEDHIYVF